LYLGFSDSNLVQAIPTKSKRLKVNWRNLGALCHLVLRAVVHPVVQNEKKKKVIFIIMLKPLNSVCIEWLLIRTAFGMSDLFLRVVLQIALWLSFFFLICKPAVSIYEYLAQHMWE